MTWLFLLFALAQPQQPPDDPIAKLLIPPELIMAHASEIALTDAQSAAIRNEVRQTQKRFIDLQWDMQDESGKMQQLLQQSPIDEAKVLERADKVMAVEREMKRAQLTLLVRLRNLLTPAQVTKLKAMR
ncbi:MAG TPA: periplasmic heavy metal sensor [Thermoanaerobaculia bacterium]|jgi:Spy/CpxP family protein refolding chaperone